MMKKRLNSTSLLLALLSFCCQSVYAIDEVVVTAPRFNSDVISNWSQPVSYGFDSMVNDGPGSYGAAKKAEAIKQCQAAAIEAKSICNSNAIKTLNQEQLGCAALAASAGVYTVVAGASVVTGIGAPVGVVVGAFGAIQAAGAAYCYNSVTNTKNLADIQCDAQQRAAAKKCDEI